MIFAKIHRIKGRQIKYFWTANKKEGVNKPSGENPYELKIKILNHSLETAK